MALALIGLLAGVLAQPTQAMPIQEVAGASGVKAWLVEDHSLPVVTLRFSFPGGAALGSVPSADGRSRGGIALFGRA